MNRIGIFSRIHSILQVDCMVTLVQPQLIRYVVGMVLSITSQCPKVKSLNSIHHHTTNKPTFCGSINLDIIPYLHKLSKLQIKRDYQLWELVVLIVRIKGVSICNSGSLHNSTQSMPILVLFRTDNIKMFFRQ